MTVLVIGGSGSGKSGYAEQEACFLSEENGAGKYYVATMQVFDEEGKKTVDRHRRMRKGKGFVTIEQPADIDRAIGKIGPKPSVVLLECISNLTANEMFSAKEGQRPAEETAGKIIREMEGLQRAAGHLVVVSGNVSEDGIVYEETVMEYIRAMGRINRALARMADRVVEVAAGIPIVVKGK